MIIVSYLIDPRRAPTRVDIYARSCYSDVEILTMVVLRESELNEEVRRDAWRWLLKLSYPWSLKDPKNWAQWRGIMPREKEPIYIIATRDPASRMLMVRGTTACRHRADSSSWAS